MALALVTASIGSAPGGASTPSGDSGAQRIQPRVAGADSSRRGCFQNRSLKRELVDRRAATWRWQRTLGLDRAKTNHPERWVRGCAYLRYLKHVWAHRADDLWRIWSRLQGDVEFAIRWVFGRYAAQALSVARCESSLSRNARNGQYENVFQMGLSERRLYGWHVAGSPAIDAARAAHRYFVLSGRDWSPWECKP